MKIPISKTYFDAADEEAILAPLRSGWVVQGPQVAEFEQAFADFCGAKYAVAATSCTTALHIAALAAGIQPGDEVLVPAFTWVATANAVEYIGAKPVFCDVSLETFNLDISLLEALITKKTKAILPVHLFGWPAEMNAILELAQMPAVFQCHGQRLRRHAGVRDLAILEEVGSHEINQPDCNGRSLW